MLASSSSTNKSSNRLASDRLVELDAIRGLAALAVVICHFTYGYNRLWGHDESFSFSVPWGASGVQVFFVLSGFVILMSLERAGSVRDFAVNRAIRLYPAYWIAIVTTFAVVSIFGLPGNEVSPTDAAVNFSMAQSAFGIKDVDGSYWTLYVELCFYLLMAGIFGFGLQRWLIPIISAFCIVGLLNTRFGWWHEWPGFWRLEKMWPLRQFLPYFFLGILLYRSRIEGLKRYLMPLSLCFALMVVQSDWTRALTATLVMVPATQIPLPLLRTRGLVFLGFVSYSLYLLHSNIGYVIIRKCYELQLSGYVGVTVAFVVVMLLATCSAYLIEGRACKALRGQWNSWCTTRAIVASGHEGLEVGGQRG
jgi:peptidoglycan/LPS O-acetylase OafA/YrhL